MCTGGMKDSGTMTSEPTGCTGDQSNLALNREQIRHYQSLSDQTSLQGRTFADEYQQTGHALPFPPVAKSGRLPQPLTSSHPYWIVARSRASCIYEPIVHRYISPPLTSVTRDSVLRLYRQTQLWFRFQGIAIRSTSADQATNPNRQLARSNAPARNDLKSLPFLLDLHKEPLLHSHPRLSSRCRD